MLFSVLILFIGLVEASCASTLFSCASTCLRSRAHEFLGVPVAQPSSCLVVSGKFATPRKNFDAFFGARSAEAEGPGTPKLPNRSQGNSPKSSARNREPFQLRPAMARENLAEGNSSGGLAFSLFLRYIAPAWRGVHAGIMCRPAFLVSMLTFGNSCKRSEALQALQPLGVTGVSQERRTVPRDARERLRARPFSVGASPMVEPFGPS